MLKGKGLYGKRMACVKGTAAYFAPFLKVFSTEMLWAVEDTRKILAYRWSNSIAPWEFLQYDPP